VVLKHAAVAPSTRIVVARIAAIPLPHYDGAMSFSDTIFLFFLALILFGPKKLPEMARKAGRLMAELRRASNEFRSQIESEIAHLEVEKPQTVSSPASPPQGTVASLSLNPGSSPVTPNESSETPAAALASSASETILQTPNAASAEPTTPSTSESSTGPVADPAASQESHV
jgi:sec-independent protein translocase protein TatB